MTTAFPLENKDASPSKRARVEAREGPTTAHLPFDTPWGTKTSHDPRGHVCAELVQPTRPTMPVPPGAEIIPAEEGKRLATWSLHWGTPEDEKQPGEAAEALKTVLTDCRNASQGMARWTLRTPLRDMTNTAEATVRCRHDLPAASFKIHNTRSKHCGQTFYCCSLPRGHPDRCSTWVLEKELAECTNPSYADPMTVLSKEQKDACGDDEELVRQALWARCISTPEIRQQAWTGAQRGPDWHKQRRDRLSASNSGAAAFMNPYCNLTELIRQMLHGIWEDRVPMVYGRTFEDTVRDVYILLMRLALGGAEEGAKLTVTEPGMWIHPNLHWMAASPDGVLALDGVPQALIEIKAPYSKRDGADGFYPDAALPNGLRAPIPKYYYTQMQMQMAVCGALPLTYFVVMHARGIQVTAVPFDEPFWSNVLMPRYETFRTQYMALAVARECGRLERGSVLPAPRPLLSNPQLAPEKEEAADDHPQA